MGGTASTGWGLHAVEKKGVVSADGWDAVDLV
jgi:hypothetical protein